MKYLWAFVALASVHLVRGRGLKAPRTSDTDSVRSKQLEAENEELRQKNDKLEGMLQVARAEVRRVDIANAAARASTQQRQGSSDETEVLQQEIVDLKQKMKGMQSDNMDLVQTLRRMMTRNATQIFEKQAEHAKEMNMEMAMRAAKERRELEAKVKERESQIQDINGKCDDTKEMAKNLEEENDKLQQKLRDMQAELDKASQTNKDLMANKAYLLTTMQSLVTENDKFKQELTKESNLEKTEAKELEADKSTLKKLAKKTPPKEAPKKQPTVAAKPLLGHHKQSVAEKNLVKAMNAMDGIDPTAAGSLAEAEKDFLGKDASHEVKKAEEGHAHSHLDEWLGLPESKEPEKKEATVADAAAPQVKAAQDLDAEATDLLNDAKAQLAAMDADS